MSVDDHGLETLKKAAEEITPGDHSEYQYRTRVTRSALPDGAATESTLSAFKTEAHQDSLDTQAAVDELKAVTQSEFDQTQTILGTLATEATLAAFKAEAKSESDATQALIQAEFDETQVKQDATNTKLDAANLSLDAIEASTASIDGKIADNFGVLTGAVRVAAIPGNISGIADFGTGTTGTQTPRVSANITRNGTELSYDFGASGANTLRVAALPGNATGIADFNAGTTSAQTIRTASNDHGIVQTSAPSAGSNATVKQVTLDAYGVAAPRLALETTWGRKFSSCTAKQALTGTTETAFYHFKNPSGSGITASIARVHLGPTFGNNYVTYCAYIDATITADGTALAEVGGRQSSQATALVQTFLSPTVSAFGANMIGCWTVSGLSGLQLIIPFDQLVEANHNLVITRTLSANATIGGVVIEWFEA